MKYIRTKDGRIIDLKKRFGHLPWCKSKEEFEKESHTPYKHYFYLDKETSQIFFYNCYTNCPESVEFVKQADTIEELCDEFVCDHNNGTRVIQIKECKPQFPFCEDTVDYFRRNNQKYYGAIWTDKGLIYVAKMNEKGELELL